MSKAKFERCVIYDNLNNDEYYEQVARENLAGNGIEEPTDDELWDEINLNKDMDWEDASYDLRSFFNGGNWLAVGVVGRWDGNHAAGTTLTNWDWFISRALEDCGYWRITEDKRGHFTVEGWHHDGKVEFEIKRLSEKGAAYLYNNDSRETHQTAWHSNFLTSLPHYCRKVWGVGA